MSNAGKIAKLGKEKEKAPKVDGNNSEKDPKMPINEYHEKLGHPNFALTCATSKDRNINLEVPCSVVPVCLVRHNKSAYPNQT